MSVAKRLAGHKHLLHARLRTRVTNELHESLALQCEKIGFADDIDQILLPARQHIGERTRDHPVIGRGETASLEAFDGEFFKATADLYFQFDTSRKIPLYIGTWGPKMARMAGGIAPGIKIDCTASPRHIAHLRAEFIAGAEAAGRDTSAIEIIVGPLTSIDEDRAAAEDTIRGMLALLQPFLAPMTTAAGISEEEVKAAYDAFTAGDVEKAKALVTDKAIRAFSLTGTPRDIIGQIEEIVAAGADHVAFGPPQGPDPMKSLGLIGEKILPHFRNRP